MYTHGTALSCGTNSIHTYSGDFDTAQKSHARAVLDDITNDSTGSDDDSLEVSGQGKGGTNGNGFEQEL